MISVPHGAVPRPAEALPEPGRYRHFKGGEYELLSVGRHTETEELFAVYRSAEDRDTIWIRPLSLFVEPVGRPDGYVPRFVRAPSPDRRLRRAWFHRAFVTATHALRAIRRLRSATPS